MNKIQDFITVNGKQLYYEMINLDFRATDKPFLVFLHEGLGSTEQWRDFPVLLSNMIQCPAIIYDRYGYGKSEMFAEARTKTYSNDEAFIFLPELIEKLHIAEKLILIGHSDGGTISLLYASKFPKKVLAIITEADHLFCEEITTKGIKNAVKEYEQGTLKEILYKFHKEKTDSVFHGWSDVWLSEEGKEWNVEEYLPMITSPVLAIQGKDDIYGSVEQLISKLKNINSSVEVLFIANCGHIPHYQAKNTVINKMSSFISSVL